MRRIVRSGSEQFWWWVLGAIHSSWRRLPWRADADVRRGRGSGHSIRRHPVESGEQVNR